MNNIISLNQKKKAHSDKALALTTDLNARIAMKVLADKNRLYQGQLLQSIRNLNEAIRLVEVTLSLMDSKQIRNALHALKNARHLLQKELKK